MKMTKKLIALVSTISAAMAVEATPYHMATPAEVEPLVKGGFAEVNGEIKDGDKVAVRLTEAGVAEAEKAKASANTPSGPPANAIPIVRAGTEGAVALDLSAFEKRARSQSAYDFDGMNKGDYFFIEATETRPNPAKSIASTVSAATKKYADKPEGERRVFQVAPFEANETKGGYTASSKGALVVRIA